jgi:hypothetical protein
MALIIAQAQTPPPLSSPWATLVGLMIPWLFLGVINGTILAVIAPRKGASAALWFFIGLIPLVGFYCAFILVSRPDVAMLERLRQLEEASKTSGTLT